MQPSQHWGQTVVQFWLPRRQLLHVALALALATISVLRLCTQPSPFYDMFKLHIANVRAIASFVFGFALALALLPRARTLCSRPSPGTTVHERITKEAERVVESLWPLPVFEYAKPAPPGLVFWHPMGTIASRITPKQPPQCKAGSAPTAYEENVQSRHVENSTASQDEEANAPYAECVRRTVGTQDQSRQEALGKDCAYMDARVPTAEQRHVQVEAFLDASPPTAVLSLIQ